MNPSETQRTEFEPLAYVVGERCPTCYSPAPNLHPAVQHEGEVQPCRDPWHGTGTPQPPAACPACKGRRGFVEGGRYGTCATCDGTGLRSTTGQAPPPAAVPLPTEANLELDLPYIEFVTRKREQAEAEAARLQAFKDWVHAYLDNHGVPHHPPGPHGAEGCRIGDRMDWLMAERDRLRADLAAMAERLAAASAALTQAAEKQGQTARERDAAVKALGMLFAWVQGEGSTQAEAYSAARAVLDAARRGTTERSESC